MKKYIKPSMEVTEVNVGAPPVNNDAKLAFKAVETERVLGSTLPINSSTSLVQEDQHSPTHVSKYKIFFSIRDLIFKVITKQEDCHYL